MHADEESGNPAKKQKYNRETGVLLLCKSQSNIEKYGLLVVPEPIEKYRGITDPFHDTTNWDAPNSSIDEIIKPAQEEETTVTWARLQSILSLVTLL